MGPNIDQSHSDQKNSLSHQSIFEPGEQSVNECNEIKSKSQCHHSSGCTTDQNVKIRHQLAATLLRGTVVFDNTQPGDQGCSRTKPSLMQDVQELAPTDLAGARNPAG
jgi:hypothetical protein